MPTLSWLRLVTGKGRALGILEGLWECWGKAEGAGGRGKGTAWHNEELAAEKVNEPQLTRETALDHLPAQIICLSLAPFCTLRVSSLEKNFPILLGFCLCECLGQKIFISGQEFLPARMDY